MFQNAEPKTTQHSVINFGGTEIIFGPEAIIYLPEFETLVVSDLHFEKGSFFASFFSPLPLYDTVETIDCLEKAIAKYQPKRIIALGDSFHDFNAGERLSEDTVKRLNNMCNKSDEWIWILGNHDKFFPENICGQKAQMVKLGNLHFSHELINQVPLVIGHFHPKMRVSTSHQRVTGKCFIYDNGLLIMPSFGTYTGGLYIDAPEIQSLFSEKPKTKLIYNKKIWNI